MKAERFIKPTGLTLVVALAFCLPILVGNYYWVSVAALALINTLLACSIRSVTLIGFFSLGQVGFALIGAYSSALLVMRAGFPMWLGMLCGALLAAVIAFAISHPFLKVKGMYFAILTLLAAETLRNMAFYWQGLTGGAQGLTNIPSPEPIRITDTLAFDLSKVTHYYYVILVVCMVSLYVLYRLERSHLNHRWRAVSDSEELAGSVGINAAGYKVLCFTVAGFFAGVAGAVFAFYQHNLSADPSSKFGVVASLTMVIYMVIGGDSRFSGPIVGTILMMVLTELSRPLHEYQNWLIGAFAVIFVVLLPGGLLRSPERVRRLRAWARAARPEGGRRP